MKTVINSHIVRLILSAYLCFNLLFFPFIPAANAQVVVDPNSGQTKVINVGGADVIQINAPSAGGVSHNQFTEYNVGENGVILNNSNFRNYNPNSKSQLNGEHIEFNLNFRGGDTARVILNEVTGNNRSMMNGTTEIYGNQADLIIANPNGITCDGCGFINVDKLSMIAGSPNMENGNIRDYNIMPMGIVEVNGLGEERFAVNTVNSAVLVADMVKLAGDINVYGDLSVLTGNDKYDPETGTVSSVDSAVKPQVAVDAYALGAMQAGNIRFYASQTGLGINIDNGYVASANGLQITADGNITVKDLAANEDIDITSTSGTVSQTHEGTITGNQDVNITGNVNFEGATNVAHDLNIKGGDVTLGKVGSDNDINITGANMALNGTVFAENDVNISGDNIDISGDYVVAESINIGATDSINAAGELQSATDINLVAQTGDITLNGVKSGNTIDIEAASGSLTFEGGTVEAATINASADTVTNKAILVSSNSEVNANKLENMGRFIINSSGGKGVYNAQFIHNYGQFASAGDLEFNALWDQINYDQSEILAAGNIDFNTGRNFINFKSEIYSGGDIAFAGVEGFLDTLTDEQKKVFGNEESIQTYFELYKNDYKGSIPDYFDMPGYTEAPEYESQEFTGSIKIEETGELLSLEGLGAELELGDSFIIGEYTVYVGKEVVTVDEDSGEETVTYVMPDSEDDDIFTVKDSEGIEIAYALELSLPDGTGGESYTPSEGGNVGQKDDVNFAAGESDEITQIDAFVKNTSSSNSLFNIGGRIESYGSIDINTSHLKNIGIDKSSHEDGVTLFDKDVAYAPSSGAWGTWEKVQYEVFTNTYLDTDAAYIIAGKDISIKAEDILNQSSTISAGRNIDIEAGSITNRTSSYSTQLYEVWNKRTDTQYTDVFGRLMRIKAARDWDTRYETTSFYSKESAKILAGNRLKLATKQLINDQIENIRDAYDNNTQEIDLDYVSNFKLPEGNGGLFRVTNDSKYLVEGNYLIFNPNQFIGSDYFFKQLGMKNTDKLLGDPAYETRLIIDQLRRTLRYSEGLSDSDQMKSLYDNAVAESGELGLQVGVALTKEQMGKLKSSIIWYEYAEVEGQTVLVPRLYAASGDNNNSTSSVIAANRVDIDATHVSNSGTIYGRESVDIKSRTVVNSGNNALINSGGSTVIESGSVRNSGTINGRDAVSVKADTIINESRFNNVAIISSQGKTFIEAGYLSNNGGFIRGDSVFVDAKTITNNNKGNFKSEMVVGSLLYIDTDDFHVVDSMSGNYRSGGDAVIKAKNVLFETSDKGVSRDPVIDVSGTLQIETENNATFKGTVVNAGNAILDIGNDLRIENNYMNGVNGAEFNIAGELIMRSSGNTTIIASQINADSAFIETGGNLTIAEAYNHSNSSNVYSHNSKKEKIYSSTATRETTVVGSSLNIGNDLYIKSGGDTTIKASQINAKNASIETEGNLSILEAYNSYQSESVNNYYHYRSGTVNNAESSSSRVAVGSTLNISGELAIKSGGDTTIRGSHVKAERAFIDTGGNLSVVEAYNNYAGYNSESSNFNNSIWRRNNAGSSNSSTTSTVSVAGSTLDIADGLSVKSGGDTTIKGSYVKAGSAFIETGGNLSVVEAYETHNSRNSNNSNTIGRWYNKGTGTSNSNSTTSIVSAAGSSLNVADVLSVKSGGDTTIRGSYVKADSAFIETGGNLTIAEAYNTTQRESLSTNYSAYHESTNVSNNKSSSTVVAGSGLNIADTLYVKSGGDTTIRGSQINAKNASIEAGGKLTIAEAYNTYSNESTNTNAVVEKYSNGERTHSYTAVANNSNTSSSNTVAGSNLNIGNVLYTTSGGDTSIIGSNINAGSASISSGGKLTIAEAYNTETNSSSVLSNGGRYLWSLSRYANEASSNASTTASGSVINVSGDMLLASGGDTLIRGSSIKADNAFLDVGGNLTVENAKNNYSYSYSQWRNVGNGSSSSVVGSGLDFAGNLSVTTGGNATIKGSKIKANNASFDIDGDFAMLEDYNTASGYSKHKKTTTNWNNQTVVGSGIDVSGGLQMATGGDFTMVASTIDAGGNVILDVGGDFAMLEAYDTSYYHSVTKKKKTFSKKTTVNIIETSTSVGSAINAGNNLVLDADGNATFRGAEIAVGSKALFDVGGNVNILATHDYDYRYSKTTKSMFGGLISETHTKMTQDQKLAASNVNVNEGLTIVSGGNTTVVGSNLSAGEDMNIFTGYVLNEDGTLSESGTGGSLNVMAGYESSIDFEETIKKNYLASFTSVLTGDIDISFSNGKIQASMTIGEETRDMTEYTTNTAVGSVLEAGGSLNVASAGDVNIEGSTILVDKDAYVKANNRISISSAQTTEDSVVEHEETTISNNVGVGNAYLDVAFLIDAAIKAGEAADDAVENYNEIKALYDEGKATKKALDQASVSMAQALLGAKNAIAAATMAIAEAMGSSATYGFYAELGLQYDSELEKTTSKTVEDVASNFIAGGNIVFDAKVMEQLGSHVVSENGNIVYNIDKNLLITAGECSNQTAYSQETKSASAGIKTNGGVSVSYGEGEASSDTSSTFYQNATTTAKNGTIYFNVGGDMIAEGYNATAKNIIANVDGSLTLSTVRDEFSEDGSSKSWGISAGDNSAGGHYSSSKYDTNSKTANISSAFVASENAVINVGGDMSLTGSQIVGADVSVDVKGDMLVVSLADDFSHNSSGKTTGVTVSVSGGIDDGNVKNLKNYSNDNNKKVQGVSDTGISGNYGYNHNEANGSWVNNTAGIIGSNSVNVNVDGKLTMEGSVIANIDADGVDLGNLNMTLGDFEFKNIDVYDSQNSSGYNVNASNVHYKGSEENAKSRYLTGDTTISLQKEGYEKEGMIYATVGQGNISISSGADISGLNRDIDAVEEVTRDEVTASLDLDINIDNRVFSISGWYNSDQTTSETYGTDDRLPILLDEEGNDIYIRYDPDGKIEYRDGENKIVSEDRLQTINMDGHTLYATKTDEDGLTVGSLEIKRNGSGIINDSIIGQYLNNISNHGFASYAGSHDVEQLSIFGPATRAQDGYHLVLDEKGEYIYFTDPDNPGGDQSKGMVWAGLNFPYGQATSQIHDIHAQKVLDNIMLNPNLSKETRTALRSGDAGTLKNIEYGLFLGATGYKSWGQVIKTNFVSHFAGNATTQLDYYKNSTGDFDDKNPLNPTNAKELKYYNKTQPLFKNLQDVKYDYKYNEIVQKRYQKAD